MYIFFSEYPPTEILGSETYMNSNKIMSFQYRTKEGDRLIAYIALSNESIPFSIPSIENNMVGCRILEIYVEPITTNGCNVDNVALRIALLDEAEHYINGWVELKSNKFEFDYLWFYNIDIKKQEIIDEIGAMFTDGDISFKILRQNLSINFSSDI